MVIETTFLESPVQLVGSSDKESSTPQQVVRFYRAWRRRIQSHKSVNVNSMELLGVYFFLMKEYFDSFLHLLFQII